MGGKAVVKKRNVVAMTIIDCYGHIGGCLREDFQLVE